MTPVKCRKRNRLPTDGSAEADGLNELGKRSFAGYQAGDCKDIAMCPVEVVEAVPAEHRHSPVKSLYSIA